MKKFGHKPIKYKTSKQNNLNHLCACSILAHAPE